MAALAFIGAGIIGLLGLLHLIYTFRDAIGPPRFFRPRDKSLLASLRQTKVALAPSGRDFWSALVGFHFSHSLGVLLFALLAVVTTNLAIGWLYPVLIAVGAVYAFLAWRYWFMIPMVGCSVGTVLLTLGWYL